ncbi:MAG: hypothetical protein K0R90_280, partial [Oscillospiraceae bacterium]|nr:hypothetical protein [Oscillospiraceae bacterium]
MDQNNEFNCDLGENGSDNFEQQSSNNFNDWMFRQPNQNQQYSPYTQETGAQQYNDGWRGYNSQMPPQNDPQNTGWNQEPNRNYYTGGCNFVPSPAQINEKKNIKNTSNKIAISVLIYLFIGSAIVFPLALLFAGLGFNLSID